MGAIISLGAALCAALVVCLAAILRRINMRSCCDEVSDDMMEELSPCRYGPLERMLHADDYEFLARQPGVDPETLKRFRARRRRLFRGYLACLSQDFNQVCAAVRALMAQAADDRPDLAGLLLRSRLYFALGLGRAQIHLALHAAGVGTVDVRSLVAALDGMRLELNGLRLATMSAAA